MPLPNAASEPNHPPMNRAFLLFLAPAASLNFCAPGAHAASPPEPPPPPPPHLLPQVKIDVLMVAIPEPRWLALLPDLNDPSRIEQVQIKLLELIAAKQVRLLDWPHISVH